MPASLARWARGAFSARSARVATASLAALVLVVSAADAGGSGDEEEPEPDGSVQIPYLETGDLRPGAEWVIDCADTGTLPGVQVGCTPEGVALTADAYDPEWGEHPLTVTQFSGGTTLTVTYRVRMAPPPAPEVSVTRIDVPLTVGAQAMIPLSMLGIVCTLCTVDGGATIAITEPDPEEDQASARSGASAEPEPLTDVAMGLSATHLSLRSDEPGEAVVPLLLTDDAGQQVTTEIAVSFVPAASAPTVVEDAVEGAGEETGALHVNMPGDAWDLTALAWGEGVTFTCPQPRPDGLVCMRDGAATFTPVPPAPDAADATVAADAGASPPQFAFRVVDAAGTVSLGSVTIGEGPLLAVPSWETEAPLHMVFVPLTEEPTPVPALDALFRLLEGVTGR